MTKNSRKKSSSIIAPSLSSADFSKLGSEIQEVEKAGAQWIHIDVMDGHFVPNLTLGPPIVQSIRKVTSLPFDCHLMVKDPEKWIEPFAKAGADWITIHVEAVIHLDRMINHIQSLGCKAGVSINPGTPLSSIEEVLDQIDLVLIMSVNPGFGGQKFIPSSIEKIKRLAQIRGRSKFLIEVDGGIHAQNIGALKQAGADAFVVGSSIFGETDRQNAIYQLRRSLEVQGHGTSKTRRK